MPVEPWQGYIPEVNAGRYEAGSGEVTWTLSAEMWTAFAAMVVETMAVFEAQMAVMGINWMGTAPVGMAAAAAAFMEWLVEMEAIAIEHAAASTAVAVAYAAGRGAMIPLPAVNANRIAEAVAEATNFMGVNSGLIAALNAEYAEFWGQNGATMMTYDTAVTTETLPKPVRPPPPLASLAGATGNLGRAAAEAAAKAGIGNASRAGMQGLGQSVQSSTQAGSAAAQGPQSMSSMFGSAGQMMSMPTQAFGQVGQLGNSLGAPAKALMSPFQSLISSMGGNLNGGDASALGMAGPAAGAFNGASLTGAESSGSGFTPMAGMGGGLGGSMMSQGAYMGAGAAPRGQPVFAGVTSKPSELAPMPAGGSGGGLHGGGGMAPHAASAQQAGGSRKAESSVPAVHTVRAIAPAEEREADEMFGDR